MCQIWRPDRGVAFVITTTCRRGGGGVGKRVGEWESEVLYVHDPKCARPTRLDESCWELSVHYAWPGCTEMVTDCLRNVNRQSLV